MDRQHRRTADGPWLLARTAAVVTTGCAALHLASGATHVLWTTVAVACLPCAVHLWRRPGRMAWSGHVALGLAMAAHPVVAAALPAAGHLHGGGPVAGSTAAPSMLAVLSLLLAAWRWWLGRDLPLPHRTARHQRGRHPHPAIKPCADVPGRHSDTDMNPHGSGAVGIRRHSGHRRMSKAASPTHL